MLVATSGREWRQNSKLVLAPLIFIVDDDPNLARLCRVIISSHGWRARAFVSAKEALSLIEAEQHPDALVLDLMMPEMNGRAFYERARLAGFKNPVLILSAYGADAARRDLGADAALSKPFDPEDLIDVLAPLLANH